MSPLLGDSFPVNLREKSFTYNFKVGIVFRLHSVDTNPPKIKRFAIMGINEGMGKAGIIFINSEPPQNPYLKSLQFKIECDGSRPYLDHDSHLDCSRIFERDISDLKAKFIADPSINIGFLSSSDLEVARQLTMSSKIIPRSSKIIYGLV